MDVSSVAYNNDALKIPLHRNNTRATIPRTSIPPSSATPLKTHAQTAKQIEIVQGILSATPQEHVLPCAMLTLQQYIHMKIGLIFYVKIKPMQEDYPLLLLKFILSLNQKAKPINLELIQRYLQITEDPALKIELEQIMALSHCSLIFDRKIQNLLAPFLLDTTSIILLTGSSHASCGVTCCVYLGIFSELTTFLQQMHNALKEECKIKIRQKSKDDRKHPTPSQRARGHKASAKTEQHISILAEFQSRSGPVLEIINKLILRLKKEFINSQKLVLPSDLHYLIQSIKTFKQCYQTLIEKDERGIKKLTVLLGASPPPSPNKDFLEHCYKFADLAISSLEILRPLALGNCVLAQDHGKPPAPATPKSQKSEAQPSLKTAKKAEEKEDDDEPTDSPKETAKKKVTAPPKSLLANDFDKKSEAQLPTPFIIKEIAHFMKCFVTSMQTDWEKSVSTEPLALQMKRSYKEVEDHLYFSFNALEQFVEALFAKDSAQAALHFHTLISDWHVTTEQCLSLPFRQRYHKNPHSHELTDYTDECHLTLSPESTQHIVANSNGLLLSRYLWSYIKIEKPDELPENQKWLILSQILWEGAELSQPFPTAWVKLVLKRQYESLQFFMDQFVSAATKNSRYELCQQMIDLLKPDGFLEKRILAKLETEGWQKMPKPVMRKSASENTCLSIIEKIGRFMAAYRSKYGDNASYFILCYTIQNHLQRLRIAQRVDTKTLSPHLQAYAARNLMSSIQWAFEESYQFALLSKSARKQLSLHSFSDWRTLINEEPPQNSRLDLAQIDACNYGTAVHYPRRPERSEVIKRFCAVIEHSKTQCVVDLSAPPNRIPADSFLASVQRTVGAGITQLDIHVTDMLERVLRNGS